MWLSVFLSLGKRQGWKCRLLGSVPGSRSRAAPQLCALPRARKCSSSSTRGCHWLLSNFLCFSCLRACLQNAGCLQGSTEQGELEGPSAEGAQACVRPLTCRVLFQMYRLTLRTSKETVSQRLCELLSEQF